MDLEKGQSLGAYEILGKLGAGGMGEVYRAKDARLGREVAIKVLPQSVRTNPDAMSRFEREARAVAALSHPNILAIHDFGETDGVAFAVVELLEGETLRETLNGGALPARKAIALARQVAKGLAAAHDNGIVHRDLKPENLFITQDGQVKILDFGLARSSDDVAGSRVEDTPTYTHLTGPGTVLGTIHYMSPEQARGEVAGTASDIFSLGTVLYEMLTGSRPFDRETAPETMTAILRDDPAEADLPPALQRIVWRCLEKRPQERFQSARDLAFALEGTSSSMSDVSGVSAVSVADGPPQTQGTARLLLGLTLLLAGIALGFFLSRLLTDPGPQGDPVKIDILAYSGLESHPAASPDGRTVAFSALRGETSGIWLRDTVSGDEAQITNGRDTFARFNSDGSTLLFVRRDQGRSSLYSVPRVGGAPRKILPIVSEADWSPSGDQVVFVRAAGSTEVLGIANADGSQPEVIYEVQGQNISSPRWSPQGDAVAFVLVESNNNVPLQIGVLDLATREVRFIPRTWPSLSGITWSGPDHLVFGWSDDLLAGNSNTTSCVSRLDVASGEMEDLFWSRNMLLSSTGTRLDIVAPGILVHGTIGGSQGLSEFDLVDGRPTNGRELTSASAVDRQPVYAPDGRTILFSSNRGGNLDLWSLELETNRITRVTHDVANDWDPAFMPDGEHILWSSDRSGNLEIWTANTDGSEARQISADGVDAENPTATADGEWIFYMTSNPNKRGAWKIRYDGTDAERIWEGSGYIPQVSRDGARVAFAEQTAANLARLNVMELASGELNILPGEIERSNNIAGGNSGRSRWIDSDTIAILTVRGDRNGIEAQEYSPGRDTQATRRILAGFQLDLYIESFDISPDTTRIVLSRFRPRGEVFLVENVPLIVPTYSN